MKRMTAEELLVMREANATICESMARLIRAGYVDDALTIASDYGRCSNLADVLMVREDAEREAGGLEA